MKKIFKFFTLSLILLLTSIMINPTIANASSVNSSKDTLKEFLNSIVTLDFDKAISLSKDSRVSNKQEHFNLLEESLQDPNEQITSYEILDKTVKQGDSEILFAKLNYLNGSVYNVPFKLEKSNTKWIVSISGSVPLEDQYIKLKDGKEIKNKENYNMREAMRQVATWNCSLSGKSMMQTIHLVLRLYPSSNLSNVAVMAKNMKPTFPTTSFGEAYN